MDCSVLAQPFSAHSYWFSNLLCGMQEAALRQQGALVFYEELPNLSPVTDGTRVYNGSGFGALENRVRALCGDAPISDLDFTCTLDPKRRSGISFLIAAHFLAQIRNKPLPLV